LLQVTWELVKVKEELPDLLPVVKDEVHDNDINEEKKVINTFLSLLVYLLQFLIVYVLNV